MDGFTQPGEIGSNRVKNTHQSHHSNNGLGLPVSKSKKGGTGSKPTKSNRKFITPKYITIPVPRLIRKLVDKYMTLPYLFRMLSLLIAILFVILLFFEVFLNKQQVEAYQLGPSEKILKKPISLLAQSLQLSPDGKTYQYNEGYKPSNELAGQSTIPKFSADFAVDNSGKVTIKDPVNDISIALKPKFGLKQPKQQDNRLVYPISGSSAKKVYTLGASTIKEDILLNEFIKKELKYSYDLELPAQLEARKEADGSIGIYGPNNNLLSGQIATGTEQDAKLLDSARKNAKKTQLLFSLPAPFVIEAKKKISKEATAHFELEGNKLTIVASNLDKAKYPISIDPSVYIDSAAKLMRGNNETNIDFDVDNELIQKSQTTGARIDAWSSTTNLSSAVYGQGTAVAGGYIYSVGGVGSGTVNSTTYNTAGSSTYSVPSGVTNVTIKMWGGGGGGGAGSNGSGVGGTGGGGGYAKAVIDVTPGENLTIRVGAGGAKATANQRGGSGGEASKVTRSSTILLEAGGGGGGGGRRGNTSGTEGDAGAGGGTTGQQGRAGSSGPPGLGGTQVAGGTGGNGTGDGATGASQGGGDGASTGACTTNVTGTGSNGTGGVGGVFTTTCAAGGGGGGGYYGGGGGASTSTNNASGGGGGGGSSYINPTGLVSGTDVNTVGSYQTPGNNGDSDRGGLGDGGAGGTTSAAATAGENGIIVISYTTPGSITNKVYWARFNQNNNSIESPNPGTGACSGWCNQSVYDLPTSLTGLSLVAYNGFLYAIGGSNSSGVPQTTVYVAKLGANGEPQLWHPTNTDKSSWVYWYTDTALTSARSQFAAVAYNNRLYIVGGLTTSSSVLSTNTVQMADIKPNGTLSSFTTTGMQALSGSSGGNRYGLTAHIYNDTLYVIGGDASFSGSPVSNVDYARLNSDGTMNSWVQTESMVNGGRLTLGGSFSTVYGGYLYIIGGCSAVNASGYCTTLSSDVQLSSLNADGSLAGWNTIIGLTNDRFAHTAVAWQGGLYRLGGCRAQDTGSGACTNTALDVDYGVINPDGEASTVATSVDSGTSPCSGSEPYNCSLPSASVGNMLNATAVLNGYLYIMGGCASNNCGTYSTGVTYQAIGSDGSLRRPSSCAGTYVDSYCVSYNSLPTAISAPGVAIFNNRLYLVGGFPSIDNIYYVDIGSDGSVGDWQNIGTGATAADNVSYTFAFARANPSSAGSNPGNLFILGGCSGTISGIGCSGYSQAVYKCNITTSGSVTGCTTSGQLQIGTVTGASGSGLGAHAGAVYANYIYLMGGLAPGITDLTTIRYARIDNNNDIVAVSGSTWIEGSNQLITGRRRGTGFGYNGFLYVLGGYDGADAIADIEFAKLNVSDGSWEVFDQSSVTIQKRWALTSVVSNSYAYVIGGCTAGPAPTGCTTRTNTIQTFQIYNNDSGTPVGYNASANQFATDRMGAGSVIYNGYIYVAGGCTSTTTDCDTVTDNVQFAPLDAYGNIGTWANTTDATLPAGRAHGKLLEAGGTLYWVGGQNAAGTAQADVYYGVPDAVTGNVSSWISATNGLPAARSQLGAASWNNRLYITGGVDGSGSVQSTTYVSPILSSGGNITSSWSTSTAFTVARSGHTTIAYANNLYVFGGYDGTNYLNDSQFSKIDGSTGSVGSWTFTNSLPTPLRQADGFAANGYIYLVGGRTSDNNCAPKTLVTPVSANTTIATGNNPTGVGEWFETNRRYDGARYGAAVSYDRGKLYMLGGACNGFPSFKDRLTQEFTTDTTTHNVTMPSTVNSGDLLLVLLTNDGNATVTDPDGAGAWTSVSSATSGTAVRASVWAKVADGSEDGTNVNFVTSATEQAAVQVYRVPANEWSGSIAGVEASAAATGSTNVPNPANLDPTGWGTENTLWIAYAGGSSYASVTSYPANMAGGAHNLSNTGIAGASVSSAWQNSATASLNPGTFTMGTTTDGVAYTIAIRPSGYAMMGSNKVVQTAVYSQPQVASYSRMIDTDTDVFPTKWLMNGIDNSIGARWRLKYRSMHDLDTLVNPNEDCGTSATMPTMTNWGQETNFGNVTLGQPETYTPKEAGGGNINCARYFYFYVNIDASRTFGYPEDVNRGPTINDLSLFFTSDPSKRMRHGKTFTGGEQQPLDTPF